MIPDYTNMEITNRISSSPGTTQYLQDDYYFLDSTSWTADKTGFIYISVLSVLVYTASSPYQLVLFIINDREVCMSEMGYFTSGSYPVHFSNILPINKGDIVKVRVVTKTSVNMVAFNAMCYYIPPIFISDEEMINTALINRPDKWIIGQEYNFGDGLYGQRFSGYVTGNAGEFNSKTLYGPDLALNEMVSCGGWMNIGNPNKVLIGCSSDNGSWNTGVSIVDHEYTNIEQRDCITIGCKLYITQTVDSPNNRYDIWIKYTKK
jgi:hypothetical protein